LGKRPSARGGTRGKSFDIVLDASRFEALRNDPRLPPLLALGRAANAVTLCQGPLSAPWLLDTPRANRVRFSAVFHTGAVLTEALLAAERLPKHFRHLRQYKDGFGQLLADPAVKALRRTALYRLRNEGVFHFDERMFARALATLPPGNHIVISAKSTIVDDVYFELADDAVFEAVMGPFKDDDEKVERLGWLLSQITNLLDRFIAASHPLIAVTLIELGALRTKHQRASSPEAM
jgi:hypothetical protein